jgi:hypothetical protein
MLIKFALQRRNSEWLAGRVHMKPFHDFGIYLTYDVQKRGMNIVSHCSWEYSIFHGKKVHL